MSTRFALVLLFLSLALAGCAEKIVNIYQNQGSLFADRSSYIASDLENKIRSYFPISTNLKAWNLMNEILNEISPDKEHPYSAVVLDSEVVNAFASSDHKFFITTGLLLAADSEDEIAAVSAHEISHVELKHIENMIEDSAAVKRLFDVLNRASQNREFEADKNVIQILKGKKYQPQALISFFKRLEIFEYKTKANESLGSTHPQTRQRIEVFKQELIANNLQIDVEPRSSSALFNATRTEETARRRNYQVTCCFPEEPPRFKSGNDSLDGRLFPLYMNVMNGQDLDLTLKKLSLIREELGLSKLAKGAIDIALARIYLHKADSDNFRSTLKKIEEEWSDPAISRWLYDENLFEYGQSASGKELWLELSKKPECQASTDCLRRSAEVAFKFFLKDEESFLAIKRFKEKVLMEKDPELKKYSIASLNYLPVREVIENLRTGKKADTNATGLVDSSASPYLEDWLTYERRLDSLNTSWEFGRKGFFLSLGSFVGLPTDPQAIYYGQAMVQLGYRYRPWEFSLEFEQFGFSANNNSALGGISYSAQYINSYFLSVSHDLTADIRHFYLRGSIGGSNVSGNISNVMGSAQYYSASSGPTLEAALGYLWTPWTRTKYGWWIDVGVNYQRQQMPGYWGTNGILNWFGTYLMFRWSAGTPEPTDYKTIFAQPNVPY